MTFASLLVSGTIVLMWLGAFLHASVGLSNQNVQFSLSLPVTPSYVILRMLSLQLVLITLKQEMFAKLNLLAIE